MASTTRITGMYSGMDTDKLVEEMLAANKTPLNNYQREKTEVEWQRETLIDLNSQLLEYQNLAKEMQDEASFKVYTAESTNSRIATASATTEALEGTYRITTNQLARAATYTSMPVSQNTLMSSIKNEGFISYSNNLENTAFNVTLNGETKTIVFGPGEKIQMGDDVAAKFQKKIDDAFGAGQITVTSGSLGVLGYTLGFKCGDNALKLPITIKSIDEETKNKLKDEYGGIEFGDALAPDKLNIKSGSTNIFDTSVTIADFTGTSKTEMEFTINGRTQTISTQTTIADFFKKINNLGQDINIKYDSLSDAVIIKRESTGKGRDIRIGDDVGLFNSLGFSDTGGKNTADMTDEEFENYKKTSQRYSAGQNAIVSITDPEGRTRTGLELTGNSFTYEGVNFNLTKAAPGEEVSITVAKDVDKVFDNVMKFVDKYNTILGKLNELYNEKPNRDYDPLLDEERDELTDTQQEKWDKLARQGVLYRDSTLQSTISSMRSAVTSVLSTNSDITSLFQIGISTTKYSSTGSDNGKLIVDEAKLREVITNNMDEVAELFTNKPDYITGTVIDTANTTITAGSSFKITVDGKEETITFEKDYDLSNNEQKAELISAINSTLSSKFGARNIIFALSSDRMVITSQKGNSVTLNSGDGTDALASLGIEDGVKYDANALGFANKISYIMERAQTDITNKAGSSSTTEDESTLGTRMGKLNDYIAKQKDRLEILEDRYYAQFSAMETALAQMESQSSYLTSMLSGSGM